jgi:hypothetical protein
MTYLGAINKTFGDPGDPGGGQGGVPGWPGEVPVASAPAGSAWAMTPRWVDVRWEFDEPEPAGACTGFDVAIYVPGPGGEGPDGGAPAVPAEAVEDPGARRHVALVELRAGVELKAAVRARYGAFRSAWAPAAAAAPFVPDALPSGADSGAVRLPDGTVMQWLTGPEWAAQGAYDVAWPAPFPSACHCAAVTAVAPDGASMGANDNWLQMIAWGAAGARLYKQGSGTAGVDMPLRAHIVAWGR